MRRFEAKYKVDNSARDEYGDDKEQEEADSVEATTMAGFSTSEVFEPFLVSGRWMT